MQTKLLAAIGSGAVIASALTAHGVAWGSLTARVRDIAVKGHLPKREMQRVQSVFAKADPGLPRVLVMHHNLLRGEMSIIGPRPTLQVQVDQYAERERGRLAVKPGITGWAQLNDLRQDTPIEQRTIYDTYYVDNWSLAFDLKILFATFARVFVHRNAY